MWSVSACSKLVIWMGVLLLGRLFVTNEATSCLAISVIVPFNHGPVDALGLSGEPESFPTKRLVSGELRFQSNPKPSSFLNHRC